MSGYCAIGIVNNKTPANLGTLWRSAEAFGAAMLFTIGERYSYQATDVSKATRKIPYVPYPTVEAFLAARPFDTPLIGVEIVEGAVELPCFKHPPKAVYLLGPEDGSIPRQLLAACQAVVKIDTKFCLNVATAGSIVLYDRRAKRGGRP